MNNDASILRDLFATAIAAADPMLCVPAALPARPSGRVVVIGAGKASARMAEAVEQAWGPCDGLVITRYGYGRPCQGIEIVEAAHPVPDAAGQAATERVLALLEGLGADDYVLALISGGASALLVAPVAGVSLADKQALNDALLASGAPIGQMNLVRKHLSCVKGGQLAAAAFPARMEALLISDVPGDVPADIGSGPTLGAPGSVADARAVLEQWRVSVPASIERALAGPSRVVAPGDIRLSRAETRIIAAPRQSLDAAAEQARKAGFEVEILGDAIEGEAREVARAHADFARAVQAERDAAAPPLVLLSGGELTVTRSGAGRGGPNAEYALALAVELQGCAGITALAGDTDGVDGAQEVAGAIIDANTLAKARQLGIDATMSLAENDSHGFFHALGDQVITGPTLTNVNDFRAIIIRPKA